MTSYFQLARQTIDEEPEEDTTIFEMARPSKTQDIIPPVGLAKPELVTSFMENIDNEDQILKKIAETEAYEKETVPETAIRETAGHLARGAEGFFGGIGAFLNLLTPELYQDEEGMPYSPEEQPEGFPSPSKLREFTKEKTGSYLEPKTELSKVSQDLVSDIGSMFSTPGLGVLQKILLPVAGQGAKQIIKSTGGTEKSQEIGKLGVMTLASIAGLGNAPRIASNALTAAENMIPRGLSFTARPTQNALNRIRASNWFRTGATPSKAPAMAEIERIEAQIRNGMLDGRAAMQLRRDINESRRQLGAFQLNRPVNRRQALRYLDEVDEALMASMGHYGNNVNPQWWNAYRQANEAFRITQRSRLISDFVAQHAAPLKSETAKILFHSIGPAAFAKLPAVGAAAVPIAATAKTIQIMNRMIRSPVLRDHYIDVLRQASLGNAATMNKSLQKLDEEARKIESINNSRQS